MQAIPIRFDVKPGIIKSIAPMNNNMRTSKLVCPKSQPCKDEAKARVPIIPEMNGMIRVCNSPIPNKRGSKTKKYGIKNATSPYLTATRAIRIGFSPDNAAAAKAANATGGVIADSIAE